MAATHYRRIDTTDPRRHDRVKAITFPAKWNDDSVDIYGFFLSTSTMISGAAMVTRLPTLSYFGLLAALANFFHDRPHQAKKESTQNATGGPVMGLCFALMGLLLITVQKLLGTPMPGTLGSLGATTSKKV